MSPLRGSSRLRCPLSQILSGHLYEILPPIALTAPSLNYGSLLFRETLLGAVFFCGVWQKDTRVAHPRAGRQIALAERLS
jgi:hypothetical protein